jgi:hypothetical protein
LLTANPLQGLRAHERLATFIYFMNIPFLKLFNPRYDLSAGLSVDGDTYRCVLLARPVKGGAPVVISLRKGAVSSLKLPFPFPVHANLGHAQTLLIVGDLQGQSAEEWIDGHEDSIIPRGAASNEIMNEWHVDADTVYSCTVTKKACEKVLSETNLDSGILSSLGMPLWDLARFYAGKISGPFFLWKLSKRESLLGFVDGGNLRGVCNFWAGADDLSANGEEAGNLLPPLVQSLAKGAACGKIVVCPDGTAPVAPDAAVPPGMEILAPPAVERVPTEYHEAFSLALHEDCGIDFSETGRTLEAAEWAASRRRSLRIVRAALLAVAAIASALIILKGGALFGARYVDGKMGPINNHIEQYKKENARLSSLSAQFREKAQFTGLRSTLTYPVSEMQTAFPEGVWAEEIVFSEAGPEAWNISIIAFSNSSGLIPELLKGLSAITGMDKVRMIYSEQTSVKSKTGERAIKLRVEGTYKKR